MRSISSVFGERQIKYHRLSTENIRNKAKIYSFRRFLICVAFFLIIASFLLFFSLYHHGHHLFQTFLWNDDTVENIPGLSPQPSFRHYSGYLSATKNRLLHYWFVESASNPSKDPLVLWLNGGPGCSSLEGFLVENGPFHLKPATVELYYNNYSWNKVANVLYLEAPAGVGFSYSPEHNYDTDDDQVSLDNYVALQDFFEKYPKFQNNDFYVMGESYAGIFVPTLAVRVLNGSAKINLKGFAIGNGMISESRKHNSFIFFMYNHGLFGETMLNELIKYCCTKDIFSRETCDFYHYMSFECQKMVVKVLNFAFYSLLSPYNIYGSCYASEPARWKIDRKSLFNNINKKTEQLLNHLPPHETPHCVDDDVYVAYLNQDEVRKALNIPPQVQSWQICNHKFQYNKFYPEIMDQISFLLSKVRGLIYNGDIDIVCNFLGNQWFVDDLNRDIVEDHRFWKVGSTIAGTVKRFNNLDFITVKGAGHMVPSDKPREALQMITNFLRQKPYDQNI